MVDKSRKEFKLDKNGNVIDTAGSIYSIPWSVSTKRKTKYPEIDHYAFCKTCIHYEPCYSLDVEDQMYNRTECEFYMKKAD